MQRVPGVSTPIYVQTDKNEPWPEDKMFYLLTSDGLFLCRNHEWFKSCSRAKRGPGELESQEPFAEISYPTIPKHIVESAVAFFRKIFKTKHWESALILAWNKQTNEIELLCPEQKCSYGSVNYEIPHLPPHMVLMGDIHSHCDFSPSPSKIDEDDEVNRPGLHIVCGYLKDKKPSFHVITVIDGERFEVKDHSAVMEPFEDNGEFPKEWLDKVTKKEWEFKGGGTFYTGGGSDYGGEFLNAPYYNQVKGPTNKIDEAKVENCLAELSLYEKCPTMEHVRQKLFACALSPSYLWCEQKAQEFVAAWQKGDAVNEKTGKE